MTGDGHRRWEDDLGGYLLGALTDVERREMELHLAGCRRCQEDERRLRASLDALAAGVPQVEPPHSLERKVMRAARQGIPRAHRPVWERARRPAAVLAASALVAGAVGGYALRDGGNGDGNGARTLSARATPAAPGARARMSVRRGSAELVVERLPAPRPGHVYQVWLRESRRIVPSTLFTVDRRGRGAAAIPGGIGRGVQEVMVSEEPALGSTVPTSAPRLRISFA
jgi:anti-sigma-K factor RskA